MAAGALTDRYAANLHGVLSCYDRIIVTGTLPGACYAAGMTSFLYSRGIRIFDYPRFAEPLRDALFRVTNMRDIDVDGDRAVLHKKFNGQVAKADGTSDRLNWQTL